MKAELVALTGFAILAVGGGAVAYNVYRGWESERAVDASVDRALAGSGLGFLGLAPGKGGNDLQWLEALYAKPGDRDRLHAGYAALRATWANDAPRLERGRPLFSDRTFDDARLVEEIDERFGAGAAALMQAQDAERRELAIAAERERRDLEDRARALADENMEAVADYINSTGQYPPAGARIENGRVVVP